MISEKQTEMEAANCRRGPGETGFFDGTTLLADLSCAPFSPARKRGFDRLDFAVDLDFLTLQSGISAVRLQLQPRHEGGMRLRLPPDVSVFGAVEKGAFAVVLPDLGRQQFTTRDWFIVRTRDLQFWAGEAVSLLLFLAPSDVLRRILTLAGPSECGTLRCFTCPQLQEPSIVQGPGGDRLRWLTERIQISEKGLEARLSLEAHCLEWLRELFRQPQLSTRRMCNSVCPQWEEKILRDVAAYLDANLEADHALADLSRRFCLNEFKLKGGFKALFGVPVFCYLRKARMQRAAQLLKETEASVLEVANSVGYSNPSHFARNFKQQMGLLPKSYQSLHRSPW